MANINKDMLVVLLCCMMKLMQFSTGKLAYNAAPATAPVDDINNNKENEKSNPRPRGKYYRKRRFRRRGKGMAEVAVGVRGSPDSDCNSNHQGSASYLSNTSSQDIDFIQDNSDYQWFLDYGYRDGCTNHHTSILSLPESYEAGDNYYDTISKNMDANLAECDMESFKTEDIHALLTNLPPMCTDHLSQENSRQGECYASVSGSMMAKFDLDSSLSPHSSSQDSANSTSMSICKSELLFSPVKEMPPMPGANFSVDSLDDNFHDMMLTCQANKDNYTIAFEGSMTMYSEDSEYNEDKNSTALGMAQWLTKTQANSIKQQLLEASMTQSDSGSFTTWSKLKKRSSDNQLRRHPSGNNNNSGDDASGLGLEDTALKSQSMPNLFKQKLRNLIASGYLKSQSNSSEDTCTVKQRPVKVFDIQHQIQSCSGSLSDMATSVDASSSEAATNKQQANFSLFKLFMKQKSMSTEGMSTTMDQLSSSENWPASQSGESSNSESKDKVSENSEKDRTYDLIAEEPEDISYSVDQISESLSRMSLGTADADLQHNMNNNNSFGQDNTNRAKLASPRKAKPLKNDLTNRSIQTSQFSEINYLKHAHKTSPNINANRPPIKVIESSFLNKLKQEGQVQKPVYVLYPNYVLPNLDFLNNKEEDISKILLMPQKAPKFSVTNKKRPFSFSDLESLKKKGFSHIKDWDSLNFLLPQEYKKILSEMPELSEQLKTKEKMPSKLKRRPLSCDSTNNVSSSSSTATQPSSGYRGSSSILTDSQNSPAQNLNPLLIYKYDSVTSSEASLMTSDRKTITTAPPLPVRCVSLPQNEVAPPRPPLPRGILRKGLDKEKRYSMYETSEEENVEDNNSKRKSLPEPFYQINLRNKRFSETEDEGVDAGTSSSSMDENQDNLLRADLLLSNISNEDLAQLEEYLKISSISSENEDHTEESMTQLRSYVTKFLSLKINQSGCDHFGGKKSVSFAEKVNVLPKQFETKFIPPNNSPNVSAFLHQKPYQTKNLTDMTICEESESPNYSSPQSTPVHHKNSSLAQKETLIFSVTNSVDQILQYFASASNQSQLEALGDSSMHPACAKLALTTICPAIYAVLSDGLKPNLETSFGAINNSVWQVVEASAQQGPLTKALNELVMRINSEDIITEGLVKFNAFVFGLLNVRSLDAWISFLRTRETLIKKHYNADSLMILSHTGSPNVRLLLDKMVDALQPLSELPFQLDLLYEYRQLHLSFKRMDSFHQPLSPTHKHSPSLFKQFLRSSRSNSESEDVKSFKLQDETLPDLLSNSGSLKKCKERPRSCVESGVSRPNFKLGEDVTIMQKKRWSGIAMNSKLYTAFDRLAKDEEEYTDSLENPTVAEEIPSLAPDGAPESLDSNFSVSDEKPLNGRRFKKLQQKWEMLSGRESSESPPQSPTHKSKIPRPITSPIKPSGIPVPVSPTSKTVKKKVITPPGNNSGNMKNVAVKNVKNSPAKKSGPRTSRVDQLEQPNETPRHVPRPSSLPYKASTSNGKSGKITPPRRAASSSLNRKQPPKKTTTPKVVRTLGHRLPSESGHLSYNDGEKLRVVLEVDDKWLLCCRGTQKGLVPRSAVIAVDSRF